MGTEKGHVGSSAPRGRETRSLLGASGGVNGAAREKAGPLCSDVLVLPSLTVKEIG